MRPDKPSQPKRVRIDLRTPPPVETDDNGAQDQGRDPEACTMLKVVHGSAVELGHVPPRSVRMRKDFIWVTVRNRVGLHGPPDLLSV
jgi:hypothetical protein